jgi:hypothetical protein
MRIFKEIFIENEKKWHKVLKSLAEVVSSLKSQVFLLL